MTAPLNVPKVPRRALVSGGAAMNRVLGLQEEIESGMYASGLEGLPSVDPGSWLKAVITARTPVTYNPALPPWPQDVMYECVIVDIGATVSMRLPEYGRPAIGMEARIIPQNVGEVCWVVRRNTEEGEPVAEIAVLKERLWIRPCQKGSGGGVPPPGARNPNPGLRPTPVPTNPSTDPGGAQYALEG